MERVGILLATGVAIFWGSADVCATLAARRLGTMTTTFISLIVSVITLTLFGIAAASQRWGWFLPIFWTRFFGALALAGVIGWRSYRSRNTQISGSAGSEKGPGVFLFRLGAGFALGVGLLETAGLVMYSVGTQIAAASIVATISSTFTLIPILFGITFLRERPAVNQLIGVGMVIAGLLLLGIKPV